MESEFNFDVLIIGTGSAGLMNALQLDDKLKVALIAKDKILEGSSYYAQGGISAVLDKSDNFSTHINDTLIAGDQLGNIKQSNLWSMKRLIRSHSLKIMVLNSPKKIINII